MEYSENESNTANLKLQIYDLLAKSFIRLDIGDQQLMRRFGLTITQSWALVHLADAEGRSLSELAKLLMCDKSNVTGIVDKLEEAGLAVRKRGKAGDRRYTRVVLTDTGHHLRQAIVAAREHMVRERLRALDVQDLHQLHSALEKLTQLVNSQFETDEETRILDYAFEQHQLSTVPQEV